MDYIVHKIPNAGAAKMAIEHHYLHRKPQISYAFGLFDGLEPIGFITFGLPPSRTLQKSVCPKSPNLSIELNRLWVDDQAPRNTESFFIARALKELPPLIVCSYADTRQGHKGYVYRASNWYYAGYTDMDRKTPRCDYAVPGKHSRDAFRNRNGYIKVTRPPKYRYWTVTGNRREKARLESMAGWPKLDWREIYPRS